MPSRAQERGMGLDFKGKEADSQEDEKRQMFGKQMLIGPEF